MSPQHYTAAGTIRGICNCAYWTLAGTGRHQVGHMVPLAVKVVRQTVLVVRPALPALRVGRTALEAVRPELYPLEAG